MLVDLNLTKKSVWEAVYNLYTASYLYSKLA